MVKQEAKASTAMVLTGFAPSILSSEQSATNQNIWISIGVSAFLRTTTVAEIKSSVRIEIDFTGQTTPRLLNNMTVG